MAVDDSYEIMPYKEIVELKKQIAELQRKTGDISSKGLLESMAALTNSMNSMLQLFSSAAEEMKLEEKTESELSEQIAPLIDKVDRLEEQNKTIAEGLVAIADMVKEFKKERKTGEGFRHLPPKREKKEELPLEDLPSSEPPELPPLEPPEPELPPLEPFNTLPPMGPPKNEMPEGPSFFSTGSPRVVPRRVMPPPRMPPMGNMRPPRMPPPMYPPPGGFDLGELPPLPPLEEEPKKKKGVFGLFKK